MKKDIIDIIIRKSLSMDGINEAELQDTLIKSGSDRRIDNIRQAAEKWLSERPEKIQPSEKEIEAWLGERFPIDHAKLLEERSNSLKSFLREREQLGAKPTSREKFAYRAVMGGVGIGLVADGMQRLQNERSQGNEERKSWVSRIGAAAEIGSGACLGWAALVSEKGRGLIR